MAKSTCIFNGNGEGFDIENNTEKEEGKDAFVHVDTNVSLNKIVNVSVQKFKNKTYVFRFDFITIKDSEVFAESSYSSASYVNSKNLNMLGLHELIMDFYEDRLGFIYTSKTNQAFITALHNTNKSFEKKYNIDLKTYCNNISIHGYQTTAEKNKVSNGSSIVVLDGYMVDKEADEFYNEKLNCPNVFKIMDAVAEILYNEYISILETMHTHKFSCVCVNTTENFKHAMLLDPSLPMPFIAYNKFFIDEYIRYTINNILQSDMRIAYGIDNVVINAWALMPNTTLDKLMNMYGERGVLHQEYNEEEFEEMDFMIGKYKTISMTIDDIDSKHETIFAHI